MTSDMRDAFLKIGVDIQFAEQFVELFVEQSGGCTGFTGCGCAGTGCWHVSPCGTQAFVASAVICRIRVFPNTIKGISGVDVAKQSLGCLPWISQNLIRRQLWTTYDVD